MKKKKVNNTTEEIPNPKEQTHDWEDYRCSLSLKMKPVNQASLERFAQAWVDYANSHEDYIYIHRYPIMQGISRETILRWSKRCPELVEAHNHVRTLCSMRQLEGSVNRKYDGNFVKWMIPQFDEDFKKLEEWRSKLKDQDETKSGPQVVVIERFPEPEKS